MNSSEKITAIFIIISIAVVGSIGAYIGLDMIGNHLEDIEDEKFYEQPIDYFEAEWLNYFYEKDNRRDVFGGDDTAPTDEAVVNDSNIYSDGYRYFHNDQEMFRITFWQLDPEFKLGGNNWIITKGIKEFDYTDCGPVIEKTQICNTGKLFEKWDIYGLEPQPDCRNHPSVCFDDLDTIFMVITEMNPNAKILVEDMVDINKRFYKAERIQDGRIIVGMIPDGIMPQTERHHNTLPLFSSHIPFEFIEPKPCFWDSDPRVCELEFRVQALEESN